MAMECSEDNIRGTKLEWKTCSLVVEVLGCGIGKVQIAYRPGREHD